MVVKLIALNTGEQLLSEVNETESGVQLTKPAILVPAGDKGLGLAPWLPYTKAQEDGIFVKSSAIMYMVDPVDQLRNHYSGTFVGGLVVPQTEVSAPKLQLVEG
jgi:hypothetical protein